MLRWLIALAAIFTLSALADGESPVPTASKAPLPATVAHTGYLLPAGDAPHALAPANVLPPIKLSSAAVSAGSEAYVPHPGDLVLFDDFNSLHHILYKLAGTGTPLHVAMVIVGEDGKPALLEMTGPLAITARATILDVEPRMAHYPGSVQVRRIRQPLTPEQSHDLTCFAKAQVGKSFAVCRVALQGTLLCCRSGLRRSLFGHTYFNRSRWFCSEMVVAAGTTAHIFDPGTHLANTIYPRDLAFDETLDISHLYYPIQTWVAESPTSSDRSRLSQR